MGKRRRKLSFVEPFIKKLGFFPCAIDAAEIPAGFKAGGKDACKDPSIMKELIGSGDEESVYQKGGEGRLALAKIKVAASGKNSV